MRILILDLKWSYGIEEITGILFKQLSKRCDVAVISASESRLLESIKIGRSSSYWDMLLAAINPLFHIKIFRAVRRFRPDVVYIISPHIANAAFVVYCRLFTGINVITHIHDPGHYGKGLVSGFVNSLSLIESRLSHRVYCWGATIQSEICSRFRIARSQVAVFRHGPGQQTPCDAFAPDPAGGVRRHFSMVGALQKRKGIEYFLQAAILFNLKHGNHKVDFVLAGDGRLDEYCEQMAKIPNLIVRNRFISDTEINEILGDSLALVLPYVGGVLQSSFVAIAYGNGCPVIVSNIGSLPEEVENGKTGYVVDKANASDLAEALTKIYLDSERAIMTENCVAAYREKFNWDAIGEAIYRDMKTSLSRLRGAVEPRRTVPHEQTEEAQSQGHQPHGD